MEGLSVDLEVELGHGSALADAEVVDGDLLAGEEAAEELLGDALGVGAVGVLELGAHVALDLLLLLLHVVHFYLIIILNLK